MKNLLLIFACFICISTYAQKAPTFSAAEQSKVVSILKGSNLAAVFDKNGEMRIDQISNIGKVQALPTGGFKQPGGTAAWALIKSHWVLIADDVVKGFKTQLGQEKFKQLNAIVQPKVGK
jgi:hypothetical protein